MSIYLEYFEVIFMVENHFFVESCLSYLTRHCPSACDTLVTLE